MFATTLHVSRKRCASSLSTSTCSSFPSREPIALAKTFLFSDAETNVFQEFELAVVELMPNQNSHRRLLIVPNRLNRVILRPVGSPIKNGPDLGGKGPAPTGRVWGGAHSQNVNLQGLAAAGLRGDDAEY